MQYEARLIVRHVTHDHTRSFHVSLLIREASRNLSLLLGSSCDTNFAFFKINFIQGFFFFFGKNSI